MSECVQAARFSVSEDRGVVVLQAVTDSVDCFPIGPAAQLFFFLPSNICN